MGDFNYLNLQEFNQQQIKISATLYRMSEK